MKKLFFCAVLVSSLAGQTYAQVNGHLSETPTEKNFLLNPLSVRNRHIVYLQNNAKMIFEMPNTDAYKKMRDLDSLVSIFAQDVAFYKDSLDAAGHVKIDYVFTPDPMVRKLRFKKYTADGDLFIRNHGELSRLKVDRDTVTFLFEDTCCSKVLKDRKIPAQTTRTGAVTFYVNNYSDISELTRSKEMMHHIIDTLSENSATNKKKPWDNYTTIVYKPYYFGKSARFEKVKAVSDGDDEMRGLPHRNQMLVGNASIGVGLLRNTLAPMAELYLELQDRWKWKHSNQDRYYSFYRVSASPYFLFDKNAKGEYTVNDNWFVNAEIGTEYDNKTFGVQSRRASIGCGYLFGPKGGYFQNTTFKVFTNIEILPKVTLSPELIITNDFKQVFPGITLKVF